MHGVVMVVVLLQSSHGNMCVYFINIFHRLVVRFETTADERVIGAIMFL